LHMRARRILAEETCRKMFHKQLFRSPPALESLWLA
jgi:hypothetical protein